MKYLAGLFSIDVCAYAIMENHYHLVIKVNSTIQWSDKRVLMTWAGLFDLPELCERFLRGELLSKPELALVCHHAQIYRKRLMSISWFMKCLNEYIARRANTEDGCSGHFWESRFKSQALLDERALLTCMCYVDLNPIRAAMSTTPETSDHTSVQDRIQGNDSHLLSFGQSHRQLPFALKNYLDLVDYTGRTIRAHKHGYIPNELPPILARLKLNKDTWFTELNSYQTIGFSAVGTVKQLKVFCRKVGKKFAIGLKLAPRLE